MFTIALSNPRGINPQAAWDAQFNAALTATQSLDPANTDQTLDTALRAWEQGSGGLAADPAYQAAERYCIRQSYLWQIYAAFEVQAQGAAVGSSIHDRAIDVVEETPVASRPADLSFRDGANTIPQTLEHLRQVWLFYPQAVREARGLESATATLQPSPGFQALAIVEGNANPAQAENLFQRLLADNTRVRAVLLGADATADQVDILDNCIFDSGQAIEPGFALWVKSRTLLRASISTWLGATIPHNYDQLRCIFVSPLGKPSGILNLADVFSFTSVSLKIVQAAQADDDPGS